MQLEYFDHESREDGPQVNLRFLEKLKGKERGKQRSSCVDDLDIAGGEKIVLTTYILF